MRKTVKKLVSILGGLLLLTILTVSCNGWMQDDGFMENIEDEVSVANADRIATYVRYPNTKMGTTSPSGDAILKVNVPMDITATTNTEYGFYKWAAFKKGTDEGEFDTSKQNSSLYYKSVEYYEENYAQYELPSSVVEFVDPTAESTSVKIKEKRNDVVIVPIVVERPFYTASVPANGKSDVVLNQAIRILMSKAISGEKLAENIKITAGTAVFTEDTEDSDAEDITDRFDITLSKTGKMITCKLKSTDGENKILMPTKSQITVTIYSDLKDTLGYTMEENQKIIFQTGSVTDTLAPTYLENPIAGIGNVAYGFNFMGRKGSQETVENVFATTYVNFKNKFTNKEYYLNPTDSSAYTSSENKDRDADFEFAKYFRQRVYDKLNIVVRAADLAGSGTKAGNETIEDDVAFIKIRAKLVRDANNTPLTTEYSANGTIGYQAGGIDDSDDYAYKGTLTLPKARSDKTELQEEDYGTLFTYNLDSLLDADKKPYKLTDGLVRIDLWTVDMIGNEGKDDAYWDNHDNGIRTLYVVKDQTPPNINVNSIKSEAGATGSYLAVTNNWYNPTTFESIKISAKDQNAVVDSGFVQGDIDYTSSKSDLMWIFKVNPSSDWNPEAENADVWKKVYSNLPEDEITFGKGLVSADGVVNIKVAAKDDLGNVSAPVALGSVYYDHVTPSLGQVSWTGINGATAGCTNKEVLDNQILNIPFVEATSGIQKVKLEILEPGKQSSYQTPFESNNLEITYDGNTISNYNISGDTITFEIQDEQNHTYFTTGTLSIQGIKIANTISEGSYNVSVTITDGAQNAVKKSYEEFIYVDKTVPVVEKIEIPGLKKAKELSTQTLHGPDEKYWIDSSYIGGDCNDNYDPTKLAVYLTITEDNSGVRKIILGGTTNVQSGTTVYKVDDNGNETQFAGIEIDSTENSIKITDVLQAFKGSTSFKIAIKNLKGVRAAGDASSPTANTVTVKLIDVAENVSTEASTMKVKDTETVIDGFYSDSWHCGLETVNLVDRDGSGNTTATSGYTNDEIVNLTISMGYEDKNASGHNRFVLTGATFITEGANKTVVTFKDVKNDSNTPTSAFGGKVLTDYEISADKKTITFKNNDAYLVFRHRTCIEFKNVKLDTTTDGSKDVTVQAFDLAGWDYPESAKKSSSIILDKTKPEWRYDIFSASTDKYTTGTVGTNVYPHPNGESAKGINITGKTNGDENAVSYFYTSAKIGDDYGAVLGIPCKDDTQLRGYKGKDSLSYIIYEHLDSATSTMNAATVVANGSIPTSDANGKKTGSDSDWKKEFNGWTFFEAGKTYSIVVLDEAGNYSDKAQTVTIVQDTTPPVTTNVQKSMYLNAPANTNVFRNITSKQVHYSNTDSKNLFWDDPKSNGTSHSTPDLQVIEYVIKDTSSLSDSYEIIIPFGSGRANGTVGLDGLKTTAVSASDLAKTTVTTSAAPLESYSISHWYGNWKAESASTDDYRPSFPQDTISPTGDLIAYLGAMYGYSTSGNSSHITSRASWHPYLTDRGTVYTDGNSSGAADTYHKVSSKVNENGDIVIYLNKSKTTEPLSLLLRDGCGNLNYVLVKPYTADTNSELGKFHVSWVVDSKIGAGNTSRNVGMNPFMGALSSEEGVQYGGDGCANPAYDVDGNPVADRKYYGYQTSSWRPNKIGSEDGQSVIGTLMRDVYKKVTYYNNNAYIGLFNDAESCQFGTKSTKSSDDTNGYTVRARIRAWDKNASNPPTQNDFIGAGTTGGEGTDFSSWYYLRDTISTGHNEYTLQYPHPTSRTVPYKLYYYVEDAVGNYEINTIVNSNSDTDMIYWMYDNAGPSVLTRDKKLDPSNITGANIGELVASNNGFRPYYDSETGTCYVVKTRTQRGSYELPPILGDGVILGGVDGGEDLKWGNYFDLNITETSGIRAYTYSTSVTAPAYNSNSCTGTNSMGDSTTGIWYAGSCTNDSKTRILYNREIGSAFSSSNTYFKSPNSAEHNNEHMYSKYGEEYYDYYDSDYGITRYSGVKVCETIPFGLVKGTPTDLYLHVMDWVGNITTVKLGNGIKWVDENTNTKTSGTTNYQHSSETYYVSDSPNQYSSCFTFAATKDAIKNASSLKVYLPGKYADGSAAESGDTKAYTNTSGIYGWSRTANDITKVYKDATGSYIELTSTEIQKVKAGGSNDPFYVYVYDNVGWCNRVLVTFEGDKTPKPFTIYVRANQFDNYRTYVKDTLSDVRVGCNNPTNATASQTVISSPDDTNVTSAAFTKDSKMMFVLNMGLTSDDDNGTYYLPGEENIRRAYPKGFYKGYVHNWNGTAWVKVDEFTRGQNNKWLYYPAGGSEVNSYYTLDCVSSNGDGTDNYSVSLNNSNPYYRITVVDNAGNESYAYIKLLQDITAPTVTVVDGSIEKVNQVSGINYINDNSKANIKYSDTGSGLASYKNKSGSTTLLTSEDGYVTQAEVMSIPLSSQSINASKKIVFNATDKLDNGGEVNLEYNGKSDWVKDTTPPVATAMSTETVKKYTHNWGTPDQTGTLFIIESITTAPNGYTNINGSIKATVNPTGKGATVNLSDVTSFSFKPEATDTDEKGNNNLYGWVVNTTGTKPAFVSITGDSSVSFKAGNKYTFASLPSKTDTYYFYPVDKAGNAGEPLTLSFEEPVKPEITSLATGTNIIANTVNYFNENSTITAVVRNPSTKDISITSYSLTYYQGNQYKGITENLSTGVNITAGGTGNITVPLSGLKTLGISNAALFLFVNTDFTSSEYKMFDTHFTYDGDAPTNIKIDTVNDQSGTNAYSSKSDDAALIFGSGATSVKVTFTVADAVGVEGYAFSNTATEWKTELEFPTNTTGTKLVYAKDKLGNISSSVSISYTKDSTGPTISAVDDDTSTIEKAYRSLNDVSYGPGCGEITFTVTALDTNGIRGYILDDGAEQQSNEFKVTPSSAVASHIFYAVDNVGNKSAGTTITFTEDNSVVAPTVTVGAFKDASGNDVSAANSTGSGSSYVYNGNVVKTVTISSVTTAEASGAVTTGYSESDTTEPTLWVASGTDNITITLNTSATTYYIWSKDVFGNVDKTSISIVSDTTGPTGTAGFTFQKGVVDASTSDYVTTDGITYYNNNVDSIVVSVIDQSDAYAMPAAFLCYSANDGTKSTPVASPITIDISSLADTTEYKIYAVDHVGNYSASLGSVKVKKHVTGPVVSNTNTPAYSGLNSMPRYNEKNILGIGGGHSMNPDAESVSDTGTTIYTWKNGNPDKKDTTNNYTIRKVSSGTTFTLPVTGLPSSTVYCELTYNSIVEPIFSTSYTVSNNQITNVPVDLSQLDKRFMFIFVWYKDVLGNVSVYNLTYPSSTGQNWWTSDSGENNNNVDSGTGIFTITTTPAANVNGSIAGRTLSGLKELFIPKSRKSTSTSSIAPTAATTTTAPKTKATKTKKSKAAKSPVVQELPTESFAEMPALESVDVLGALERSSNANSSADGIATAGKAVEIVKQQAENLTAEPKTAASGVMGSEIEVSEESGNNIAYIILGVMAVVICSIVAGFVVHKRKIH